jgi:predicted ATP-grasp superfamily ATP-dependent carboligase
MELVERARDISMFALHADACEKGTLPQFAVSAPSEHVVHGKAIVFAREDVVVGDTRACLDDPTVRDVPREGDEIAAGQPICTVLATGSDEDRCYAELVERADGVYRLLT